MRPKGSPKKLERRRRRAVELLASGLTVKQVADRLGVAVMSVYRWQQAATAGGPAALTSRPASGRPPKLTDAQCDRLLMLLPTPPESWGLPPGRWTLNRIAALIRQQFGVDYHPHHVWRLLRRCGWARAKPGPETRRHT